MRVLFLTTVWPEPTSSAAGVRVLGLAKNFLKAGATVFWGSACKPNSFQAELDRLGIITREVQLNDSSFNEWLREVRPDGVVFERFIVEEQFGARVREEAAGAWTALDTSDLHSVRRAREKWVLKNLNHDSGLDLQAISKIPSIPSEFLFTEDTFRELASIHRCDLTWVVSFSEALALERFFAVDPKKISVLPIDLGVERAECRKDFSERIGLGFIGNFRHPPNLDAVRFLKFQLWPEVRRKIPDATLSIFGAYPSKEAMAWSNPREGFVVLGPADDSRAMLSSVRVLVAPIRFGAGVKGKILDSWSVGTPVITTEIGAEGVLPEGSENPCLVPGANLQEWVATIQEMTSDAKAWSTGSQRSMDAFNRVYTSQAIDVRFRSDFQKLLHPVRKGSEPFHWIQEILWMNQLRSTDYFSRWIEAKTAQKSRNNSP
ncbi:MAG: glycosyltransferase family 4 protein [Bdellovibrionales bacterium]|nr:glycosyltransferase family 4 protein [Bdellovibrionales bacterium]